MEAGLFRIAILIMKMFSHEGPMLVVPNAELLATLQGLGHTAGSLLADYLADGDVYKEYCLQGAFAHNYI
jgi:hypothetical protein